MPNIGLSYTSAQMSDMLDSAGKGKVLLGLVFKPVISTNSIEFKIQRAIRTLNADIDPIEFVPVPNPQPQKKKLYRENNGVLKPAQNPDHYQTGDQLEYFDSNFNFSFFYAGAISALIAISERVIISGADIHSGMMAFPPKGLAKRNGTLKMEIDKESLKIRKGVREEQIPAAIIGTPCPPWWRPR